ncbi:hypothetical protein K7B07_09030 [Niabella sp. 3A5MI-3]|nr:hypothetical protein [Niabella beijingensis]
MSASVEVFKTNVVNKPVANRLKRALEKLLPHSRISFDLEDCDRVLRVEAQIPVDAALIARFMQQEGYAAAILL